MSDIDKKIQEVRQRIARQTGNQVVGGDQSFKKRISAIRSQVNINNNDQNSSPFIRRQSSNYSMQGDGQLDQMASFGGACGNSNVYNNNKSVRNNDFNGFSMNAYGRRNQRGKITSHFRNPHPM